MKILHDSIRISEIKHNLNLHTHKSADLPSLVIK